MSMTIRQPMLTLPFQAVGLPLMWTPITAVEFLPVLIPQLPKLRNPTLTTPEKSNALTTLILSLNLPTVISPQYITPNRPQSTFMLTTPPPVTGDTPIMAAPIGDGATLALGSLGIGVGTGDGIPIGLGDLHSAGDPPGARVRHGVGPAAGVHLSDGQFPHVQIDPPAQSVPDMQARDLQETIARATAAPTDLHRVLLLA